jgi:transcription antitermination factor NusG
VTSYWALATTASNCEAIAAKNLARQGIISYAPKYRKVHFRRSERYERTCQLFPGYLFIRVVDRWRSVLFTRGIIGVVGGEYPSSVADGVVDDLIAAEKASEGAISLPWVMGQTLRIKEGALAGQLVIYDGMGKNARERVLLRAMGGYRPINIPGHSLEAAAY